MTLYSKPIGRTGKDIYTVTCDNCNCSKSIGTKFGIISERMLWIESEDIKNIGWASVKEDEVIKDYCEKCKEDLICQTAKTQSR